MTVEENTRSCTGQPVLTGNKGKTISIILDCMKKAATPFKKACKQPNLRLPLNENQLAQIYVEQVDVQMPHHIGVKNQYSDIFLGTKGIPDFYFHKKEEGKTHFPFLVVEAKRLPSPEKMREKEYVMGNNENGGIERFKIEKHGKGLCIGGMLGFVENNTFPFWLQAINTWITGLSETSDFWQNDENLVEVESSSNFSVFKSVVHRTSQKDVLLYHLWIDIK